MCNMHRRMHYVRTANYRNNGGFSIFFLCNLDGRKVICKLIVGWSFLFNHQPEGIQRFLEINLFVLHCLQPSPNASMTLSFFRFKDSECLEKSSLRYERYIGDYGAKQINI